MVAPQQPCASSHARQRRFVVCDRCGASLEVALQGGVARCTHCGADNQVRVPAEIALQPSPAATEQERLTRLAAQDHGYDLPDDVAALVATGRVLPSRLGEAKQLWQTLRNAVRAGNEAALESLFALTRVLAERLLDDRDLVGQRALIESSLELLTSQQYQQVLRAYLARGACRAGDVASAEAWLATLTPRSDDLPSDTAYRYAKAYVDTAKGNWAGVLLVLGGAAGAVPLWDEHEPDCAVLRAHAWEAKGEVGHAVDLLVSLYRDGGPAARARAKRFLTLHADWNLCPASEPKAERRHRWFTPPINKNRTAQDPTIGTLLLYSISGLGVAVALLVTDDAITLDHVISVLLGGGAVLFFARVWFKLRRKLRRRRRTLTGGVSTSAQVVKVTRQSRRVLDAVDLDVTLRIFPDDAPAYITYVLVALPIEVADSIQPGSPMVVRRHAEDPDNVLVEMG